MSGRGGWIVAYVAVEVFAWLARWIVIVCALGVLAWWLMP